MTGNKLQLASIATLLIAAFSGCHAPRSSQDAGGWSKWREDRRASIAGTNGWATLVGLHWLEEGRSSSGSAPTHTHVFPAGRAPAFAGVWVRDGLAVRFDPAPGVPVFVNGKPFSGGRLATDVDGHPDILSVGSLRITVIQRGRRLALRVRDPEAPTRMNFTGIGCFPFQAAWQVEAKLEPAAPGTTLPIQDITGGIEDMPSAGTLVFRHDGREHRLDAVRDDETDDLFVMFRDVTTGRETYAAGRFLHAPKPDATGHTVIDFNRAYNPPCAFTAFATCPLAPPQNRLPFRVEAGELKYKAGH